MEFAFEGCDGAGDAAVHVCECACDDAARESRGVVVVLCVEDEGDIHDFFGFWGWLRACHHVEEVCGVGEAGVWRDEVFAFDGVLHVSDHGRDYGEEAFGFVEVCFWGVVLAVWVDMGLDGDCGAEDVHRDGRVVIDEVA